MLRIPFAYARTNQVLLRKSEVMASADGEFTEQSELPVLIHSPLTGLDVLQEICRLTGPVIRIEQSSEAVLEELNKAYSQGDLDAAQVVDEVEEAVDLSRLLQEMPVSEDLLEMNDDAPVIRMINSLLKQASRDGASDIHLEAFERKSVVRFRVDGNLRDVVDMRRDLHAALVSRIKIMASLDIAE